jgi:hypothetical protein
MQPDGFDELVALINCHLSLDSRLFGRVVGKPETGR